MERQHKNNISAVRSTVQSCTPMFKEEYLQLTDVPLELFNPYRLLIMQALIRHGNVEFRQLKPVLPGMTDGNLASHLRALEKLRFIETEKEIVDRKMRTSYEITNEGRKAFEYLKNALNAFYNEGETKNE